EQAEDLRPEAELREGPLHVHTFSVGIACADYDGDGLLDVFVSWLLTLVVLDEATPRAGGRLDLCRCPRAVRKRWQQLLLTFSCFRRRLPVGSPRNDPRAQCPCAARAAAVDAGSLPINHRWAFSEAEPRPRA